MQVARNENFLIYVNVVSLKLKMLTLANAASDQRTWDASKSECLESRSGLQLFPGEIFDPWIFSGIWNGTKYFFADFSTLYFAVKVMKPQRGVPEANRSILVCVEKGNSILFHDEALFDIWGDKSNRICPVSYPLKYLCQSSHLIVTINCKDLKVLWKRGDFGTFMMVCWTLLWYKRKGQWINMGWCSHFVLYLTLSLRDV